MNPSLTQLQSRREQIIEQMRALDRMRRGSLSRQFFRVTKPGRAARHGPYYVLQGYFRGKKFGQRVRAQDASQVQQQVANYKRFQQLAEEYVTVTEQITLLEKDQPDSKKNSTAS